MDFAKLWCVGRWILWTCVFIASVTVANKVNNSDVAEKWRMTNEYQYVLLNGMCGSILLFIGCFSNVIIIYGNTTLVMQHWQLFIYTVFDIGMLFGATSITSTFPYNESDAISDSITTTAWIFVGMNINAFFVDLLAILIQYMKLSHHEVDYIPL